MDAEVKDLPDGDATQCEDKIVSQWREISADVRSELREQFDEILRPLGLQIRLAVVERANSLALIFICLTLPALTNLRQQWSTRQLKDIVQSLFTLLSGINCTVRRLRWPLTDYERTLKFFTPVQGEQTI